MWEDRWYVEIKEKGSIGVSNSNKKRRVFKWVVRGSIFTASMFMVLLFLSGIAKIQSHPQRQPTIEQARERTC